MSAWAIPPATITETVSRSTLVAHVAAGLRGVRICAQLGDDERHALGHHAADECYVTGQTIQLRHYHRGLGLAGLRQGVGSRWVRDGGAAGRRNHPPVRGRPRLRTRTRASLAVCRLSAGGV